MARCLHIYDSGFQCTEDTFEPTEFCEIHQKVVAFERLEDSPLRKMVFRLIALILLALFLIPLIYTLRSLYFDPPAKAQEVW